MRGVSRVPLPSKEVGSQKPQRFKVSSKQLWWIGVFQEIREANSTLVLFKEFFF